MHLDVRALTNQQIFSFKKFYCTVCTEIAYSKNCYFLASMSFLVLNYHKRLLTFSSFQRAKKVCRLKLLMDFVVKMLLIAHPRSCMWHAYNDSLLAMASHRQVWQVAMQPLPWQSSDVYRWRGSVLAASAVVELCPHYISRGVRRLSVNAWCLDSTALPHQLPASAAAAAAAVEYVKWCRQTILPVLRYFSY